TFHDDEEPVGAACTWLGQRAEELPDVLLNLEGLKQSVVRSVERQELHGSIRRSARGRAAPEADDVAIGVLDVEVLRAPRGRGKRVDDRYAVRCALLIERLDAVNTRRRVEMLVHTPVSAVFGVLGRFLQVKLQPVQLTDRVKPVPRLAECETEFLVVDDRAGKIIHQELWSEGCHPRLRLGCSHESPCSVMMPPNAQVQLRAILLSS